ncbi:MAG: tripartite tricarboxylate transporter permease [Deltaproteobacteria bacterium]|nr:tripartite tricarboxylate transporter permease [Deltaproteobacteria bacterium]
METIPALQQALGNMFQPSVFLAVFAATIASIIVGVLPAITGALLVIMVLPFTFGADPIIAMPVMCALLASSGMGGSITAILTGIPGDNANAPTVLDGFTMTRNGQAGRALGLALTVSVASCFFGVVLSILIIPLLAPILMKFKTVEMLLIIIMALLFLSVLTKGSRVKGLISAGLGLTLSCVGFHATSGIDRLTFGNMYLYSGIEVSTVLMGVLAVPTLLELHAEGVAIAPASAAEAGKLSALLKGTKEFFSKHLLVWLRGTLVGYAVGIAPALGSTTAVWIAYAQAKQSAKNPEAFGNGVPEGIVAPESARAVCATADLLTTLVFGIPGSSIMVVIMAAFMILGIQPGPTLVIEHTALAFQMILTMGLGISIAAVICFFGAPIMVKITRVSPHILFVVLMPIIVLGAYVTREFAVDIVFIGITSLLGLCLKRFGFSAPAIILGFVMGNLLERTLIRSMDLHGVGLFWSSPVATVLTTIILIAIFWGPIQSLIARILGKKATGEGQA